jgi:hypothetical protein
MSTPTPISPEPSPLKDIHDYLFTGPIQDYINHHKLLSGFKGQFIGINPVEGGAPVFDLWANGLVQAGLTCPHATPPSELPKLYKEIESTKHQQGEAPKVWCDHFDILETLANTPIEYLGKSSTASPSSQLASRRPLKPDPADPEKTTGTFTKATTTLTFSFHGTPDFANARNILLHGYNPHTRARQVHGAGEYHCNSLSNALRYGKFVICNLVIKHCFTDVGTCECMYVSNNPLSRSSSYMLPLMMCSGEETDDVPALLRAHVLPPRSSSPPSP